MASPTRRGKKMSPEDKQKIMDELNQKIITYTKWIEEYKQKVEATKFILKMLEQNGIVR